MQWTHISPNEAFQSLDTHRNEDVWDLDRNSCTSGKAVVKKTVL